MAALPDTILPDPRSRAIRVMIVDDSVVVRGLVSRWLIEAGGCEVVATCRSAMVALDMLDAARPDVVVLDIEMPELDGVQALPRILERRPDTAVIVISSLIGSQSDVALRCLERGAMDVLAKPGRAHQLVSASEFQADLVARVGALGRRALRRRPEESRAEAAPAAVSPVPASAGTGVVTPFPLAVTRPPLPPPVRPVQAAPPAASTASVPTSGRAESPPAMPAIPAIPAMPRPARRPAMVVVGASTGGPQAVMHFLQHIKPVIRRLPVLVVQHMPASFTPIFAEHLQRQTGLDSREIRDRELIIPGLVYVAPGGRHLRIGGQRGALRAILDDGAPVNFCRPSVDVLFESAASVLGPGVIGVVLTGMGSDGSAGASRIHGEGGLVFVQDEASSVVWGMPGAVFKAGFSDGVGTVAELGALVTRAIGMEAG